MSKNYTPIEGDIQTLDIGGDDDGELDVVVKKNQRPISKFNSFLLWIIIVTILGAVLIYLTQSNNYGNSDDYRNKAKNQNSTKINKTIISEEQNTDIDGPKLVELKDDDKESNSKVNEEQNKEVQNNKDQDDSEKQENEEKSELDFEQMQKESDKLKEDIKAYYDQKKAKEDENKNVEQDINKLENEEQNDDKKDQELKKEKLNLEISEASKDKRYDTKLCDAGYYMNREEKQCKKCEDKCVECMHILGTCYRCENQYYLNHYGKCIQKCEGYQESNNLLLSDDNKNESIPICIGKNQVQSIYMTVQKSNNTHFALPYLIIHPAYDISHLYHNSYPMVYYFNKDLFNFDQDLKLTDIVQQAQEKQLIVIILGCHTLYDFSLFNTFLFQQAIQNIEKIAKIKNQSFIAYFGQDYNAYGVIREYQAQYKNNTVDLVISDDPKEISHEYLESNLLVTHEQHYTDYNFESLQGAKSDKTTVILLFHTKNEQDQYNYCQKFQYVSFLQCAIREIQIDNYQRMKQGFELISQFVVQPDL